MRGDPNDALDAVAALIEEMRDILANGGSDAPQAFLEAAHDAQGHISRHALTSQDAVPLGACLRARLTCFIIRFLKRPQLRRHSVQPRKLPSIRFEGRASVESRQLSLDQLNLGQQGHGVGVGRRLAHLRLPLLLLNHQTPPAAALAVRR